jgi:hypothetical protein
MSEEGGNNVQSIRALFNNIDNNDEAPFKLFRVAYKICNKILGKF